MTSSQKLGEFLREVSNWGWDEFVRAEVDPKYSTNQSIIFGLVRASTLEKLDAIKLALDRLDGKLKTPVRIETPKVYYTYPYATSVASPIEGAQQLAPGDVPLATHEQTDTDTVALAPIEPEEPEEPEELDLPSMSLRQTLDRMADYPRELPQQILDNAQLVEDYCRGQPVRLLPRDEIPKVKSVMAAHLLRMAQKRKLNATYEVFDQIDGKLVETVEILGDDIEIPHYDAIAPAGAVRNSKGIYQIEAEDATMLWGRKLTEGKQRGG